MRIIYFGSDAFGTPSVRALQKGHIVAGVVTAPDKPKGRGLKISPTPAKEWAEANGIPVCQPEFLSDEKLAGFLKEIAPELIVLISYGKILPAGVLRMPSLAAINVHPSLLPRYRGAAPMEWALINGEKETGVTVIEMLAKMDAGGLIMQKRVIIDEKDDIFSLKSRLAGIAPAMLIESIEKIKNGFKPVLQAEPPTYARKLTKEDGLIQWAGEAQEIRNLIRGTKEWPGAYTYLNGKYLKIFSAEIVPPALPEPRDGAGKKPGKIIGAQAGGDSMLVACGRGILAITEVQLEGKKRMPVSEFLNGCKITVGCGFSWKRDL